jgi:hypothetical protein
MMEKNSRLTKMKKPPDGGLFEALASDIEMVAEEGLEPPTQGL